MSWLLSPEGGVATLNLVGDVLITSAVKGDIIAFDGTNWVDVTVGTNDQVLTADSAIAAGVKWADAGGIDDGTIDFAPLVWDNTNTKWVESTATLIEDTSIGSINQIRPGGNSSTVPSSAAILLGPSLGENIAFVDNVDLLTGVKLAVDFSPSDANHTLDITHFGSPAPTLEPNIQIIGKGEVRFLAGKWIFTATDMTGPGAVGIKEQAAAPASAATIGKLWVKDDTPNILKFLDDAGNDKAVLMLGDEINDLTAAVTWANIPNANVPQSAVTQHQAALTILESQITDGTILARVGSAETITESWIWSGSTDTITFTGGGPFGIQFRSTFSTSAQQIDLLFRTGPDTLAFERTSDAVKIIEIDAATLDVDFAGAITANYITSQVVTTANLNDITNVVNTAAGKVQGAVVYNSTTDNPVYATGSADGSTWVDGAGTLVHTPV